MVGDKIILAYVQDAKTVAEMVHVDGTPAGDVPIPGIGTAAGFSGKGGDPETFFAFSDFTTPTTVYRFDTSTGEITIFAQQKIAFDPTAYVTQQLFYPSKYGHRKSVVSGKSGSVRGDLGGSRIIKKKTKTNKARK